MKHTIAFIAAVACAASIASAQLTPAEKASAAAEAWLKLVDDGAYPDAYKTSSEKWRKRMNEDNFSRLLKMHHSRRGDFKSRSLRSAEKMSGENLAEGQKHDIISVRFSTEWSDAKGTELVNVVAEEDGEWRVFGYTIQGSSDRSIPDAAKQAGEPAPKDKKAKKEKKKD
jgi:hypothetical protein